MHAFKLRHRFGTLTLGKKTAVMGILNVTPDSFSDGGRFFDTHRALSHALQMIEEGADILDVGGESTRPGASPVTEAEELRRVIPIVEVLARKHRVVVSIDTSKSRVAREAIAAGASIVNDVTAMRGDPKMAAVVARARVPVILMHMKGSPRTMQKAPRYDDVVISIMKFFRARIKKAVECGVKWSNIIVDPGIGFGKRPEHNLEILKRLDEFHALGCPIMIGTSRKSFIGQVLDVPVDQRVWGTAATVAAAVLRGAHIVRVHDVREMAQVARLTDMMR